MEQVGGRAVSRRGIENRFLAGDTAQTFLDVAGTFLEDQRPGAVPGTAAAATSCGGAPWRMKLTQAERHHTELDTLVRIHLNLVQANDTEKPRA